MLDFADNSACYGTWEWRAPKIVRFLHQWKVSQLTLTNNYTYSMQAAEQIF